uniref:Putative ovule protein n=1 Tax=Solanum chacoense TaxID=4108 RepID=A0A0V0IL50_SOLCH
MGSNCFQVSSSADKSKQPKSIARTNEMVGITKSMQQPFSSQLANQARSGQVRAEAPATSHGKTLLVLKSGRENGVTSLSKEASTPANNTGNKLANCPPAVAPSAPAVTSPTSRVTSLETKAAALSLKPRSTAEKRSSLSQAQSRSDFFNLMRKKTSNSSTALPDSGMASSNSREQSCLKTKDEDSASLSPCVSENGSERTSNGDPHEAQNHVQRHNDVEENNSPINGSVYPDEKEAAFLRSLGWDENAVEEEGLTEEEINAFYQEYMKLKPSLKVYKGAQPKCLMLPELHLATNPGTASSNSTSSESDA